MDDLPKWLSETPNFTSFRINVLKEFDITCLRNHLEAQRRELRAQKIPNTYLLKEDCLIVEKWPENVCVQRGNYQVIVDASCATAVLKGAHVFAPGVLSVPTVCKLNERVDVYGDLDGQCRKGLKVRYEGRKLYVGTGRLKMQRSHLFGNGIQTSGMAVQMILPASKLPVVNEAIYPEGHILLQNLPSIVVGWVMNAKPGENILDMCAAPGNKTTHMAEMSNNQANIIALDKSKHKIEKMKKKLNSHGTTCVKAFFFNSEKCYTDSEGEINEPPFPLNSFDKVLLDAPCSGLGQRPQLVKKLTPQMLQSYKHVQRKLFEAAIKVLKVNGTLVYSTCTMNVEENELMVAWVLEKFPNMQLVPAVPLLAGVAPAKAGLSLKERFMVQRFGPKNETKRPVSDLYKNSIGFFIAKFIKIN